MQLIYPNPVVAWIWIKILLNISSGYSRIVTKFEHTSGSKTCMDLITDPIVLDQNPDPHLLLRIFLLTRLLYKIVTFQTMIESNFSNIGSNFSF